MTWSSNIFCQQQFSFPIHIPIKSGSRLGNDMCFWGQRKCDKHFESAPTSQICTYYPCHSSMVMIAFCIDELPMHQLAILRINCSIVTPCFLFNGWGLYRSSSSQESWIIPRTRHQDCVYNQDRLATMNSDGKLMNLTKASKMHMRTTRHRASAVLILVILYSP